MWLYKAVIRHTDKHNLQVCHMKGQCFKVSEKVKRFKGHLRKRKMSPVAGENEKKNEEKKEN